MEPPLVGIAEPGRGGRSGRRGRQRGLPRQRGGLHDRLLRRAPKLTGPMRRGRDERMAGGVCAAIAARFGRDLMLIRIIFVLAALLTVGLPLYVLVWLLLPMEGEEGSIAARALKDRRGIGQAVALASLLAALFVIVALLGASWANGYAWAIIISAAGLVLIWRNASAEEQVLLRQQAEPLLELTSGNRRKATGIRIAAALALVIAGLSILLSGHVGVATLRPLSGLILVVAAIVVLLGPWWLRIARDLMLERQARVRAEERSDVATRVHDSVLQTLALIQRNADQPGEVVKLARAQERELRSWLFEGRLPGDTHGECATVAEGIRLIQQDVEERHRVPVEAITVGDCELDDQLKALLAAAREATVNAAKWSGAEVVSVFAEVEPDEVSVFVRDRGCGFDPAAVPLDRKGLAESVQARMARRGGTAVVRSVLDEGTEVTLRMPRTTGARPVNRA